MCDKIVEIQAKKRRHGRLKGKGDFIKIFSLKTRSVQGETKIQRRKSSENGVYKRWMKRRMQVGSKNEMHQDEEDDMKKNKSQDKELREILRKKCIEKKKITINNNKVRDIHG